MFGSGVFRGLGVTLKQFVGTYLDDIKQIPEPLRGRQGSRSTRPAVGEQEGLFTIQYPEERRKLPERFRYIPMLIYETNAETGARKTAAPRAASAPRCARRSASGSCATRTRTASRLPGRPSSTSTRSICMNCGLCAEFCPFDAIKMNHDFEISAYKRMPHLVFDLEELSVPVSYYARIRPTDYAEEEAAKKAKEAEKAAQAGREGRPRRRPPLQPRPLRRCAAAAAADAPAAAARRCGACKALARRDRAPEGRSGRTPGG